MNRHDKEMLEIVSKNLYKKNFYKLTDLEKDLVKLQIKIVDDFVNRMFDERG